MSLHMNQQIVNLDKNISKQLQISEKKHSTEIFKQQKRLLKQINSKNR